MAKLVSLLCLLGAGLGGYFLYRDLIAVDGSGKGIPMATVERRELKVRRKPSGSYIWSHVELNQNLYRKDSVQTGAASTASIRLTDQSVLELGEDSLVVLDDIKNISLNFVRGSMVIRGEKGDRQISRAKDGKLKIEELPFRLLIPESQAIYFSKDGVKKEISFGWELKKTNNTSNNTQSYEGALVQVSTDIRFMPAKTQWVKISALREQKTKLSLLIGKYFWRVIENGMPLTEVRSFKVASAYALKPVWPLSATEKIKTWKEESGVQFRWTNKSSDVGSNDSLDSLATHRIEISSDSDFKNIVKNEVINSQNSQAIVNGLPEGMFYWRIKSQFGDVTLNSQVEKFAIEKNQKLLINPLFPLAGSSHENRKEFRFLWKTQMVSGVDYQFELQKDGKSHASERIKGTSYSWNRSLPGSYRWRVLALHQKEIAGETSWQDFVLFEGKPIQLSFPKNAQEIHYWEKPSDFTFAWEKESGFNENNFYKLEVATDLEFKSKVVEEKLSKNFLESSKLQLKPGSYYWRVGMVNDSGSLLKWSQTARFTWGQFPLLEPPSQAFPAPGAFFDVVREDKDPVLSWAQVKDAIAYEVVVINNKEGNDKVVLKQRVEQSTFQVSGLQEGEYFWSVRPIDPLKRPGSSLPRRKIDISFGKPLEAPQVLSAEVQ